MKAKHYIIFALILITCSLVSWTYGFATGAARTGMLLSERRILLTMGTARDMDADNVDNVRKALGIMLLSDIYNLKELTNNRWTWIRTTAEHIVDSALPPNRLLHDELIEEAERIHRLIKPKTAEPEHGGDA